MSLRTRLFHLWFLARRPMTLGVRAIVVDDRDRVLLVKHSYVAGWHLPGGGVEPGETALECLAREVSEEANVTIDERAELIGFYFNDMASRRDHVALYVCRNAVQRAPKTPDAEIIAAAFFALDDLPADTAMSTVRRLNEWSSGDQTDSRW